MVRVTFTSSISAWPTAVVLATAAAVVAMAATVGLSVLTGDGAAATSEVYGENGLRRSGKRAVRAEDSVPAPDATLVVHLPMIVRATDDSVLMMMRVRPLHEVYEVPESFI